MKVVSTRVKCVLSYVKIEKAALLSSPWTQVAILKEVSTYEIGKSL